VFSTMGSVLLAAAGFGVLIFVHELGHFLAAKLQGINVVTFSLGFGPPFLKRTWGGTEYRMCVIPLGGYVKLAGEEPDPEHEPQPGDFYSKSVGRRAIVFVAGVFMNIVFGFIFFIVAYRLGVPVIPAQIGGVVRGSPAWKAGLKRGDVITHIDDMKGPIDFTDVSITVMLANKGDRIRLGIERDGKRFEAAVEPEYNERLGNMQAGIIGPSRLEIGDFDPPGPDMEANDPGNFSAIYKAGLRPDSIITRLHMEGRAEDEEIHTPDDVVAAVQTSGGKAARISYMRDGVEQPPVTIKPLRRREEPWFMGIGFGLTNRVDAVREDTWASKAGFEQGDVVISVDGRRVRSCREATDALNETAENPVAVKVKRGEEERTLTVPARGNDESTEEALAFEREDRLFVDFTFPDYPAAAAGLQPGDRVTKLNGEDVEKVEDFHRVLQDCGGRPLEMVWERDGEEHKATVTPGTLWTIQIPWKQQKEVIQGGIATAFTLGTRKSFQWIVRIYSTLRGLLRGTISPRHLNGPLAIAVITYSAAQSSPGMFLYFLAVISVNLGIVNLLPIPVLDGGHLLFAAAEKLRGKPLSERLRGGLSYAGLALLIGLLVVAMWNDIRLLFLG